MDNRFPGIDTSWAFLVKGQQDKCCTGLVTIPRQLLLRGWRDQSESGGGMAQNMQEIPRFIPRC
jgi:hypothetical protein